MCHHLPVGNTCYFWFLTIILGGNCFRSLPWGNAYSGNVRLKGGETLRSSWKHRLGIWFHLLSLSRPAPLGRMRRLLLQKPLQPSMEPPGWHASGDWTHSWAFLGRASMGPSVTTPPCSMVRKLSLREAKSLTQAHTAGTRTHKSQHLSVRLAKCPPLTLQKVKVKLFSCVRLFATSWTVAYQPPSSMGFSRQEYWKRNWVAISFSGGSSQTRDRTRVSRIAGRCFAVWATRETSEVLVNFPHRFRIPKCLLSPSASWGDHHRGWVLAQSLLPPQLHLNYIFDLVCLSLSPLPGMVPWPWTAPPSPLLPSIHWAGREIF